MAIYTDTETKVIEQGNNGIIDVKKHIERIGRVCYKSLDKMTETSYEGFVNRMIKSEHGAMLEHGTIYLTFDLSTDFDKFEFFRFNRYSRVTVQDGKAYVTTNYRVIIENDIEDVLEYMTPPDYYHERRITVDFTMDRVGTQSVCRHRHNAFAQESTRYVNFFKEKFGSCIKVSRPVWIKREDITEERINKAHDFIVDAMRKKSLWERIKNMFKPDPYKDMDATDLWLIANEMSEHAYMGLVEKGWQAQQARSILPLDLTSEIVVTGYVSDWIHFLNLRSVGTTGAPHPDIKAIADVVKKELIDRGYIREDSLKKIN